jgi:prephenate dehydratase
MPLLVTKTLRVHTLGPSGTNCEAAAHHWLHQRGMSDGTVVLHPTLERAALDVLADPEPSALLACVVYPNLHEIVFKNLAQLTMRDCFVFPTHNMVYAGRAGATWRTVASHPAPVNLLDGRDVEIILVNSNAAAAAICSSGETDACITTLPAAQRHQLEIRADFGPVPMGFSLHAPQECDV